MDLLLYIESRNFAETMDVGPFDVQSIQRVIKDALASFASAGADETSLTDLNELYAAENGEFEKSLAAFEETLAAAYRYI